MTDLATSSPAIQTELRRLEENCTYSGKAHFNAAARWARYHYWLGVPSIIFSVLATAAYFKTHADIAGILSATAAVLTSLMTFLKPSEHASSHKASGDQYLALCQDARVFREIKLIHVCDVEAAMAALDQFTKRRNELNQASTPFSDKDYQKARQGIEEGEATYRVDREPQ